MDDEANDPVTSYRQIYKNIFVRNLLASLMASIFLNCTCINSLILFATGKWMLNLGKGNNVHDPTFVWTFWIVSTVVFVFIGVALAIRETRRFKADLIKSATGELKTIPYIQIEAPSLGVREDEDDFVYGKALALHLKNRLGQYNYVVPDIGSDEVGWKVFAETDGFQMEIDALGFLKDEFLESEFGDDDDDSNFDIPTGTPLELWVHVSTHPRSYWNWSRFRFIDRSELVHELNDRILSLLESDAEIQIVQCCDELPIDDELLDDDELLNDDEEHYE